MWLHGVIVPSDYKETPMPFLFENHQLLFTTMIISICPKPFLKQFSGVDTTPRFSKTTLKLF
jgi:hypothetical protein